MTLSREIAAEVLSRFEADKMKPSLRSLFYSLTDELNVMDVKTRTSAFGLIMETTKRLNTIDFILQKAVGGKLAFKNLNPFVRNLLRIATLELKFNQSKVDVERKVYGLLLKKFGRKEAAKTRIIIKKVKSFSLEDGLKNLGKPERLSILYSHPSFLVKKFISLLGENEAVELMKANLLSKTVWFRINELKMQVEDALAFF